MDDFQVYLDYPSPTTGCVLITTRYPTVSNRIERDPKKVHLEKFSPDVSLRLFNRVRLRWHEQAKVHEEEEKTIELLNMVDGLALGIKQMASYIGSNEYEISTFQAKYKRMAAMILRQDPESTSNTLDPL